MGEIECRLVDDSAPAAIAVAATASDLCAPPKITQVKLDSWLGAGGGTASKGRDAVKKDRGGGTGHDTVEKDAINESIFTACTLKPSWIPSRQLKLHSATMQCNNSAQLDHDHHLEAALVASLCELKSRERAYEESDIHTAIALSLTALCADSSDPGVVVVLDDSEEPSSIAADHGVAHTVVIDSQENGHVIEYEQHVARRVDAPGRPAVRWIAVETQVAADGGAAMVILSQESAETTIFLHETGAAACETATIAAGAGTSAAEPIWLSDSDPGPA